MGFGHASSLVWGCLAWPHHCDHKMNAETVEKAGLGIWIKEWGWGGEKLVHGKEIGRLLEQIMGDWDIKKAAKVRERRPVKLWGAQEKP
ncbi:UNVERIFIED_CONTAM: UDP-glycosyltransferase 13 [Sesamum radiatum]|uniref:UDP-glycosyltransferase 13 n=1 Tax=Sesamum radiatum TaxID=300843 RepID=A0AAW2RBT4_SESRA